MRFELTDAQNQLRTRARELAEGHVAARAAEIDDSRDYPWDTVKLLNEQGFMGMTIAPEYGGQGLTYFDAVLVIEEMAKHCAVTARIVVETNMGAISAVMKVRTSRVVTYCAMKAPSPIALRKSPMTTEKTVTEDPSRYVDRVPAISS